MARPRATTPTTASRPPRRRPAHRPSLARTRSNPATRDQGRHRHYSLASNINVSAFGLAPRRSIPRLALRRDLQSRRPPPGNYGWDSAAATSTSDGQRRHVDQQRRRPEMDELTSAYEGVLVTGITGTGEPRRFQRKRLRGHRGLPALRRRQEHDPDTRSPAADLAIPPAAPVCGSTPAQRNVAVDDNVRQRADTIRRLPLPADRRQFTDNIVTAAGRAPPYTPAARRALRPTTTTSTPYRHRHGARRTLLTDAPR